MSLDELLKNRIISRIDPNRAVALKSIKRAKRDIEATKTFDFDIPIRLVCWQFPVTPCLQLDAH